MSASSEYQRLTAIEDARSRRSASSSRRSKKTEWFIDEVSELVSLTMKRRVRIATELVKNKVITNISRPVTKSITTGGGSTISSDRSVRGEFPKADTTQLMKTIFSDYGVGRLPGNWSGFVGTPLDYGVVLEISGKLDRSFLVRTLKEEHGKIIRLLTGPIA